HHEAGEKRARASPPRPDRMRPGHCCRRPHRGIASFALGPMPSRRAGQKEGMRMDLLMDHNIGHRGPHRHWRLLRPVRRLPSSNISSSLIAASSSANCFLSGNFTLVEDGGKKVPVRIRQVPGDGSCLFHSIAAALILDDQHSASIDDARILRSCAVDVLSEGNRHLRLSRDERITSARLVEMASKQYGISPSRYLKEMKEDCVWGGGPEIVAVANHLGREIVLLEEYEESTAEIELHVLARFGGLARLGGPPIHVLSTNQKFPKERFKRKNHFVAVFKKIV
ncbi:hypothetical protein THAOC_03316, partial [Thalassiosira oceanica]